MWSGFPKARPFYALPIETTVGIANTHKNAPRISNQHPKHGGTRAPSPILPIKAKITLLLFCLVHGHLLPEFPSRFHSVRDATRSPRQESRLLSTPKGALHPTGTALPQRVKRRQCAVCLSALKYFKIISGLMAVLKKNNNEIQHSKGAGWGVLSIPLPRVL